MQVDPIQTTDEACVKKVQEGDKEAFGTLVERYEEKLLRYGRKFLSTQEDIEDIVQDVFMSAYQNIQSFDLSQRFSPWIYRIAHNAFVNGLKKHSRSPFISFDLDTLISHPVYEDPKIFEEEHKEMKKMIDVGLKELSPKYREILVLYYLEDMSYKEIAEILQVPTGTVGIRIKRAKEALREVYKEKNITYGA
jgi:RNA polymerase sigma-70 factor (ECF subfamily)